MNPSALSRAAVAALVALCLLSSARTAEAGKGTVKFFNETKGFGVIVVTDLSDKEHAQGLRFGISIEFEGGEGNDRVITGSVVEFDVVPGREGLRADHVKVIGQAKILRGGPLDDTLLEGDEWLLLDTTGGTLEITAGATVVVVGGEWKNEKDHPDFAWIPYHNTTRRETGGSENPFLAYGSLLDVIGDDIERK